MKSIVALVRLVVYSNLFVAVCAVALTHLTYIFLRLPMEGSSSVLMLVFCATYVIYNIQRIVRLRYSNLIGQNIGVRLGWILRNRSILFSSSLFLLVLGSVFLFFISVYSLAVLAALGVLSVLYVVPFIPFNKRLISLREIPYVKAFLIAGVWALVTVLIPYVNEYGFSKMEEQNFIITLVSRFLFMLAITFPFDIRDLRFDGVGDLKTLPLAIGIKKTIVYSELLLLLYVGVKWFQYVVLQQLEFSQIIAISISIFICMIIISFGVKKRAELFYSALIESSMLILHFGVLILEY